MSGNFFHPNSEACFVFDDEKVPVEAHVGNYRDFLRRYEHRAAKAVVQGVKGISEITPKLITWIADPRNIRVATERVIANGGVPGPDGLDCSKLSNSESWEMARTLKQCLKDGTYQHGPTRHQRIKKTSGNGYRTINIESQIDRIVARAILQILQPIMDPRFSDKSFGFRPGRDRRHALKAALDYLQKGNNYWVIADLKDAFDNIPVNRLMDIVRRQFPGINDSVVELIKRIAETDNKRGIRQGNPLSPFLMNIYLNHHLDGVWARRYPDEPLLRTADDMLVCCRTQERAQLALDHLRTILTPTGMKLNQKKSTVTAPQSEADGLEWLGYQLQWGEREPVVRIAESAWESLRNKLEEAHYKAGAPIRAVQILSGWLDQLGPCYEKENHEDVYRRVIRTAEALAFDEMLGLDEFRWRWRTAYVRWRCLCSGMDTLLGTTSGGSACPPFLSAACDRRSDGAHQRAPSLSFDSEETVTLYTDGSCDRLTRKGGWAVILEAPSLDDPVRGSGCLQRATNNRAELTAVIRGFGRLASPARVTVVSDSTYVVKGISDWLPRWKAQGWRGGAGRHKRPIRNLDLWKKLDVLMKPHKVICEWVRGHSGHSRNEECDRLANAARERADSRNSIPLNR